MEQMRIQDLPGDQRPREKAERLGVGALSNAELIALLVRSGYRGRNAIQVGEFLLGEFGTLNRLFRASLEELVAIPGLGRAKALELAAAIELGNRARREKVEGEPLDSPERIYELVAAEMQALNVEVLRVLLLNARLKLIGQRDVSRGSVNESLAHPREIFAPAIKSSAYALVIVHNHPSGDPAPSEADLRLTRRLSEAAGILQIRLIDHLIVGLPASGRLPYYSFREAGLL